MNTGKVYLYVACNLLGAYYVPDFIILSASHMFSHMILFTDVSLGV